MSHGITPVAPRFASRRGELDDDYGIFFGTTRGATRPIGMQPELGWRPATDVYETKDEFVIQMDLAGMRKSDIEVYVEEDFIMVKGVRSNISPPGKKHFHKMEIQIGPFERHIRIPDNVDPGSASAHYRSGFLFVSMRRGQRRPSDRRVLEVEAQD